MVGRCVACMGYVCVCVCVCVCARVCACVLGWGWWWVDTQSIRFIMYFHSTVPINLLLVAFAAGYSWGTLRHLPLAIKMDASK